MYLNRLKDKKSRKLFLVNEYLVISYKVLLFNLNFRNNIYLNNLFKYDYFNFFLYKNSISRFHNFCTVTGRSRGIVRFFGLSRLTLRELAQKGAVPGLKRSNW